MTARRLPRQRKVVNRMATPHGKPAETPEVPPTIAPTIQLTVAAPPESGIRIDYPGKLSVRSILGKLRPRVQRRLNQFCCGSEEEQANNLIIEGDNLQVMASLYRYRGQIDFILADPPYNTGNDFRYNDRWDIDPNDPNPGELVSEDDGGKHTKWMKFMAPRLEMMKAMLKPGGVCAICIDHRELFRLGMMMDEIFYESNRLAIINWQKSAAPRPDNRHVSTSTEYVLVYAKDIDKARTLSLDRSDKDNKRYSNPDNDPGGDWREGNLTAKSYSAKDDYAIQSPFTGELHYPAGHGAWRHPKQNILRWLSEWGTAYEERDIGDKKAKALMCVGGTLTSVPKAASQKASARLKQDNWPFLWFGRDGLGRPRVKTYLEKIKKGKVPVTYCCTLPKLTVVG
jgi:adenine-specific DNA-methyltransferase